MPKYYSRRKFPRTTFVLGCADLTHFSPQVSLAFTTGGSMAKLALIYGMRLLPEDDLGEVRDATVVLKNGRSARVTMHLIEGSKEEIETTFRQSIEAFFEMYPEI
jgi:hypothetical protein